MPKALPNRGTQTYYGHEIVVIIRGVQAVIKYNGEYHRSLGCDAQCNNKVYSKVVFIAGDSDPYISYEVPTECIMMMASRSMRKISELTRFICAKLSL